MTLSPFLLLSLSLMAFLSLSQDLTSLFLFFVLFLSLYPLILHAIFRRNGPEIVSALEVKVTILIKRQIV